MGKQVVLTCKYKLAAGVRSVLPDVIGGGVDDAGPWHSASIWGPTCDGFDCIVKQTQLPLLDVGRWLYFVDMGAYTSAAGSNFNGMPLPQKHFLPAPGPGPNLVATSRAFDLINRPCEPLHDG